MPRNALRRPGDAHHRVMTRVVVPAQQCYAQLMTGDPIQQDVPEDQIGQRLAELTAIINAGEEAWALRTKLMLTAVNKYHWTQTQVGDACPITQSAVSKLLSPYPTYDARRRRPAK